jgi:thiol:disulfide interchange protein
MYLKFLHLLIPVFILTGAQAQVHIPYKWTFSATDGTGSEATLYFTVKLEEGWHIYSQFIEEGGPLPTTFTFMGSKEYTLISKVKEESEPIRSYDPTFMMNIVWFKQIAVFSQKVKLHTASTNVKGKVEFMVCTDEMCLPPEEVSFSIPVKVAKPQKKVSASTAWPSRQVKEPNGGDNKTNTPVPKNNADKTTNADETTPNKKQPEKLAVLKDSTAGSGMQDDAGIISSATAELPDGGYAQSSGSLSNTFILGFLGGLAAVLMPCIFPMLPFTVGYFIKRGGSRKKQVGIALVYGLSIILIYVTLGLLITMLFGADALNDLSTNGIFNLAFFLLLIVFAASFLGAFELTLPSRWVNTADSQADRKGFLGIFFLAATLALVSFSCTGPIIGTILVQAASGISSLAGPAIGMFGFALALSLPFTVFAMFPSWMKGLPKSGGWLNSVKVVLGFLELALALKFLSNVDLAYHWKWFDREVFLVLWIIIFGLTGLYLLGKLKLPHDTDVKFISPIRLFLAIISLAFTLYMVPGLWGAPLKVIAAFLPPQQTQDFDLYSGTLAGQGFASTVKHPQKKYDDIFHAPYDLNAFFDYEEGLAYARKVNKPVMIDFTGHACVNCRKMEMNTWSDPKVLKMLRDDYVLIQLYVDDKTALPESEQVVSRFSGKKLRTLGNKWSDMQASVFHTNAQPYYVLLGGKGEQLVPPQGADYDPGRFERFLAAGIKAFRDDGHLY